MNILFNIILAVHIIGGSIGLVTGTINLVRVKGDRKHRFAGRIFTYGMLTAGFTALLLSIFDSNYFLFIVGIFTIYLAGTGRLYINLRLAGNDRKPSAVNWIITSCMLVTGLIFLTFGIVELVSRNSFGIVYIVFGFIGLRFVMIDFSNYRGKFKEKNYWLLAHLQRMTAAYIAAMTAFLVVNIKYLPVALPGAVFWLLPTVILTPFIIYWTRKYRVKQNTIPGVDQAVETNT